MFRTAERGGHAWPLSHLPGSVTVSNSTSSHGQEPDRDRCLIKLLNIATRAINLYPQTSLDHFAKVEAFIQKTHPLKGNKKVKEEGVYFCVSLIHILK